MKNPYVIFSLLLLAGIFPVQTVTAQSVNTPALPATPGINEGYCCSNPFIAQKGENWAPKKNTWFKYTADKFSTVEVNSCHINQRPTESNPWILYLYGYYDCEGTRIPDCCESVDYYCEYNPHAVMNTLVMEAGETIYLFWPQGYPNDPHANDGFYFNIKATYPTDGDVCQNAIPLTLPVINHFGSTYGFEDDYISSPCSPIVGNYLEGNDKVYTITLPEDGYLTGNIIGKYGAIHVLDACPTEELTKNHCKAFAGGQEGGHFRKKIGAGTYYVIISSWSPPQAIDFLLNLSFESTSDAENQELMNSLIVYPNPTQDRFTVAVSFDLPTGLSLELVNMTGQLVYRNELSPSYSIREEIDVSRLPKGIYYLKAGSGEELVIRKVILE